MNVTQVNGAVLGKTGVIPEKKGRFFLGDHDVTFGITGSKLSLIGGLHGTGFPYSSPFLGEQIKTEGLVLCADDQQPSFA